MNLFSRLKTFIGSCIAKGGKTPYTRRSGQGGVDAGRDSFVNLNTKETRQKKNLLRKINVYRLRKKSVGKQSFREKPVRNWLRLVLLCLCLMLSAGLFVYRDGVNNIRLLIGKIDYFHITAVEVRGCVNASAEAVRNSAGILLNSSLFALDDEATVKAVIAGNKWVDEAEILVSWPDEVVILVKEFVPVALINVSDRHGTELYYMDKEGEPFIKARAGMDLDFPVMTGFQQTEDHERSELAAEALTFLSLIRKNNPNLPSQSVSEINVDPVEGLVVYMVEHPFPIFFGSGDVRKKYFKLRKVLERLYKYKPNKGVMGIADVAYIRMNYLDNKVLVGYSRNIESG